MYLFIYPSVYLPNYQYIYLYIPPIEGSLVIQAFCSHYLHSYTVYIIFLLNFPLRCMPAVPRAPSLSFAPLAALSCPPDPY
jgi:hypothetical protein